jgi:hypothetical protein
MADNVEINAGSGGSIIAGDDVGGVIHQRAKVGWGVDGAFADVTLANPLPVVTSDFAVALGNVSGQTIIRARGEREAMGSTATGEDLWRGNELTPAPTSHVLIPTPSASGEQMTVVSEDANDASGGTGANTVIVKYLDDTGAEQSTTVTMNGLTPVDLTPANVRFVNDFYVETVGSLGVSAGMIKIYQKADSGLVYSMIGSGWNRALVPHRMVPLAKRLAIMGWHAEEAQAKRVSVRLLSTDVDGVILPGVFSMKNTAYLKQTTTGHLPVQAVIPALSIVKVAGWPDQAGADVSAGWWGVQVDD